MKKGVADLVMFGHKVTLWVETKVDRNGQSQQQREFEARVTANGGIYWIIREMDEFLTMGEALGWWR